MNLVLVSLPSILIVMSTAGLSHLARALILDPVTAGYEPVGGRAGGAVLERSSGQLVSLDGKENEI